jgi:hypothetical protein
MQRGLGSLLASPNHRAIFMVIDFQATMTEADFKRPLLDAAEERLAREARGDVDLTVEGLVDSLFSRLIRLVSGGGVRS